MTASVHARQCVLTEKMFSENSFRCKFWWLGVPPQKKLGKNCGTSGELNFENVVLSGSYRASRACGALEHATVEALKPSLRGCAQPVTPYNLDPVGSDQGMTRYNPTLYFRPRGASQVTCPIYR